MVEGTGQGCESWSEVHVRNFISYINWLLMQASEVHCWWKASFTLRYSRKKWWLLSTYPGIFANCDKKLDFFIFVSQTQCSSHAFMWLSVACVVGDSFVHSLRYFEWAFKFVINSHSKRNKAYDLLFRHEYLMEGKIAFTCLYIRGVFLKKIKIR